MEFTIKISLALGLAAMGICCGRARAADIELPVSRLIIRDRLPDDPLKRKILWRVKDPAIVIGARGSTGDPRCISDGGSGSGGTIRFFSDGSAGSTQDTGLIHLPCENWRWMGTTAHPLGYKYVDHRQAQGPCHLVRARGGRHASLRASCRGRNPSSPLDYDLTVGTDEGIVGAVLTIGTTRYCTASDDYRGRDGSDGMTFFARNSPRPAACPAPRSCDCCAGGPSTLTFHATASSQPCGRLRSFRCSNKGNATCSNDSDCDFGTCVTQLGICSNDVSAPCSNDADCQGTCTDRSEGALPKDLACGRTYTGGGGPAVGSSQVTEVAGGWESRWNVTACDSETGELTLGPTTAADTESNLTCTEGRKCSNDNAPCVSDDDCGGGTCEDRCFFGPVTPKPLTEVGLASFSLCSTAVVAEDLTGMARCGSGEVDVDLTVLTRLYQTGDLLSAATPPDVAGIQPCPLCVRVCESGANIELPCGGDSDCTGGWCSAATRCLGGENDGGSCVPGTPDAGDTFPTSHDCPPPASSFQGEGVASFRLGSTRTTVDAVDHAPALRVFCGFCRDQVTGCFEGDPRSLCPLPGDGTAMPCASNADCQEPYETCAQRSRGAFDFGGATRIELLGSTDGQCLAGAQPHDVRWGGFFCVPPTFDPSSDSGADLPGPGVSLLSGQVSLSP